MFINLESLNIKTLDHFDVVGYETATGQIYGNGLVFTVHDIPVQDEHRMFRHIDAMDYGQIDWPRHN